MVNLSLSFKEGHKARRYLTRLAQHAHQALQQQEMMKTKMPVIKKAVIPLQVKVLIFPNKRFSPALKKGVQSLLSSALHWKNTVNTAHMSQLWKKSPYKTRQN